MLDFSKMFNQKHFDLAARLLETSDGSLSQEAEPGMKRTLFFSSVSDSETLPDFMPLFPAHCNAFSSDTDNIIWEKNIDFELPLAFRAQVADSVNTCRDAKIETDMEDEDYKFFLKNIIQDGVSYAFQLKKTQDGGEAFIKYEEAEDGQRMYQSLGVNIFSKAKATSGWRENSSFQKCKLKAQVDNKKEGTKKRKRAMEMNVSGSLQAKMTGKRKAALQCNGSQAVKAEEATLQYNANQIVKSEEATLQNNFSHVVKEEPFWETSSPNEHDVEIFESRNMIQSADFKKNLEIILKEPFNTQQLHDMWNAVSCRKPIVQLRQTRRRIVPVETNQEGSSYLDYHPDLAEKVESTSSPEEKLSLLRGFFFWLKNASWADAFKPWASCYRRQSIANLNDEDDCVEVERPDSESIAIVLRMEDTVQIPLVRVKEEAPDIEN
ncbi:uncharacterized protein LOC131056709 isoform X1 [Cryptomeria japonica]|uniref:uncharacterized protein LOC131056709 isoform X1 n=3 Tax=Cryptomeria japonica TaxID=3369 RepID=UPI0025AD96CB|nr:uncharacterized protein LOC131056709 isoform X1 [Cryptomeria japonica]